MKKKFLAVITLAMMLALSMASAAWAAEGPTSGSCGANATWSFDEASGTLTISGTGDMEDYPYNMDFVDETKEKSPWYAIRLQIRNVVVEDGITSIGANSFYRCQNLTSVNMADSVVKISDHAFDVCDLVNVEMSVNITYIGDEAFSYCDFSNIEIPANVSHIGDEAFFACVNLAEIEIPANVSYIGDEAFGYCDNLAAINVVSENNNFSSINGVLFNKDKTKLLMYPVGKSDNAYSIPNTVTTIGDNAFSRSSLSKITIPNNVKSIGSYAFFFSGLRSLTVPDSVTNIGECAFWGCNNLTSVFLEDGVTSIGDAAFARCDKLVRIYIPSSVERISEGVFDCQTATFDGCLNDVYFGGTQSKANSIGLNDSNIDFKRANTNFHYNSTGWEQGTNIIAFELNGGSDYEDYDIFIHSNDDVVPNIISSIMTNSAGKLPVLPVPIWLGNNFDGWYTEPAGGDKVTTDTVFAEDITLYAHWQDTANITWTLSADGILNIYGTGVMPDYFAKEGESDAPWAYLNVVSAKFDEGLTVIGVGALYFLEEMTSVYIPSSVVYIGDEAFCGCENLTDVYFSGTEAQWNNIQIGWMNTPLEAANIHFNYVNQDVAVSRVTLNKTTLSMDKGDEETLTATVSPDNATDKTVSWSSSDPAVATVTNGLVKALKAGETTITATAGGKTAVCRVVVTGPSVTLDHSQLSVVAGSNIKFVLKATVSGKVTSDAITWSSSDTTVATVVNGEITGLKGGQAIVTAALSEDADAKAECVVNVKENPNNLSVYMVHFDANGGVIVGDSQAQVLDGESYTLPGATRSGYSFRGWQNGDDSSKLTAGGAVYVITADTSFKAVWGSTGGGGGGSSKPSKPATDEDTKKDDTKTDTTKPAQDITPGKATMGNINTVFADVKSGSWFANAVVYVYNKGMMQGVADSQFGPNDKTTRAMIVTMLYRLEGEPGAGTAAFSDVASGQWYSSAIAWASANAIVKGYETGAFGPNDAITREQLAAILYRFAEFKGYDVEAKGDLSGFADSAKVADWAKEAVQWAVGSGIINGNENNQLAPRDNATRAEVAAMLMRFCQQFEK